MTDTESVERMIPAPAEAIFALLADPTRHQDIDGSGSVKEAKGPAQRVKLGDEFGMTMKLGVPYATHNVVVEYDENRRIAWQHTTSGALRSAVGPGALWRYELEPTDSGTRVRETWDFSRVRGFKPVLRVARWRNSTRAGMEKTLENIEKLLATG